MATTTLSGLVTKTTAKAILFLAVGDDTAFWVPRSACRDGDNVDDDDTDLIVENWWLRREGRL